MPPVQNEPSWFEHLVPSGWRAVLEDLRGFIDLQEEVRGRGESGALPEQQDRLIELHDRLLSQSAALLDPDALADLPDSTLHRLFARSVLLLVRFEECVAAGPEVLDTAGSQTLRFYRADFDRSTAGLRAIHDRLEQTLGIPRSELRDIEDDVDRELADVRRKQALVTAIREEFVLYRDGPELRDAVYKLFRALYPDAPLLPEDVELVLTGTLIFFCLPFKGEELTTARFHALSHSERRAIQEFLRKVNRFKQEQFSHFPVFGFLKGETLDRGLLERLAARAGLEPREVAREITRIVTILPLAKVDEYVVHDVWGHSWQASMLCFEKMYEEMARYADPLELAESVELPDGEKMCFGDCFRQAGSEVTLDEAKFRRFVNAELAERLPVALTAVLAEIMADVAEYKFLALHPDQAEAMPSSSVFKFCPSKLDLTLHDATFYFSQATKVFRLWAEHVPRRQKTRDELVRRGVTPEAAEAAVERAVAVWQELAAWNYAPQPLWQPEPHGRLRVNALAHAALNFLGLHRAIVQTHRRLSELRPESLPLRGFRDLLIIAASVFFEADRPRNLWRVDEFLSLKFLPLCQRLEGGRP
ncbi:MAG: hypothetical protein HY000_39315 [Planctomycetes bacterium]|nr:hypothetical protein [Planctomycetota bacterium]